MYAVEDDATRAAAPTRVGRYTVARASEADEPAVRALLRQPMDGAIRLALEREPDLRYAAGVEGDRHATVVVRDAAGRLVAAGSRSVRTVWLDGAPARLGYLGQLRRDAAATAAAGPLLRAGFRALAATRAPDELGFDLTSIAADNLAARRLLERGVRGVPPYRPLAEFVTCLVPTRRPLGRRRRARPVVQSAAGRTDEVVACLARNLARHQLAPVWTAEDLTGGTRCRGLTVDDVRIVADATGRVRGCAALWDQRAFKQTRVHGYSRRLGVARPILGPLLRLTGQPPLPPPGATLALAFLSHVAVDGDDPAAFLALVDDARDRARARGLDWLVTGFAAGHPLLTALQAAARPRNYRTILYAVLHEADAPLPARDAGRRLHVEVATL